MPERPARNKPRVRRATVLRTQQLSPHMVRVVLTGPELEGFPVGGHSDAYVKLVFPRPGTELPEPFDLAQVREELPRHRWPVTRTYTVRRWDAQTAELTLDFVVHGEEGIAGPWAAGAKPGDVVHLLGPGGGYAPSRESDWHLLAGDESALPAIAAALDRLPADASARVLIEVAGPAEEQRLTAPPGAEVVWLHREGAPPGRLLVDAVRALDFPEGRVQAFVHGEAGFVKELRRHLRLDRNLPRELLSVSGYWRAGHDEDGWQASKSQWNAQVEAEQETAATPAAP
ncbi:siderophore-interacting protein [Streptomyces sp. 549]|uniref:siderophore-interacting protein n=1 Tax=Streptomyces sp. 549 TaxID=3049076 RepID=UPI0024C280DB|nr:siderophore-interacting protein [Streptomyces sp. 549]MDK1473519.1 siderophore-interacting protein [Streptomyces sp. 549]